MKNILRVEKCTLHVTLNPPSPVWSMVVAESCCFASTGTWRQIFVDRKLIGETVSPILEDKLLRAPTAGGCENRTRARVEGFSSVPLKLYYCQECSVWWWRCWRREQGDRTGRRENTRITDGGDIHKDLVLTEGTWWVINAWGEEDHVWMIGERGEDDDEDRGWNRQHDTFNVGKYTMLSKDHHAVRY